MKSRVHELRKLGSWAEAVLAALSTPVVLVDADGGIVAANPEAERQLQFPLAADRPRRMLPEWLRRQDELARTLREGQAAELVFDDAAGQRRLRLRVTPLAGGERLRLIEWQDVSGEAVMRRQLRDLERAGEDLQAAHEELLCAYEMIEVDQDRAQAAGEAQASENADLQVSNLELRNVCNEMAKMISQLRRQGHRT